MPFTNHPSGVEVLQVPGYLFWGPTGFSDESEYGDNLGFLEDGVDFFPNYNVSNLKGPYSERYVHKIYLGNTPVVKAILKNYNAVTLARLFPGLAIGNTVSSPNTGSVISGKDLNTNNNRLLFVPIDTANNPCLLIQRAVPNIEKTIKFSREKFMNFACVFDCFRTSANRSEYYLGPISGASIV